MPGRIPSELLCYSACDICRCKHETLKRADPPSVVVGVVGIAHSVEVELLEQLDVRQHGVFGDSFAPPLLMHVTVDPFDHNGPVVMQQLPPLYLILAEPHLQHVHRCNASATILCPKQSFGCGA